MLIYILLAFIAIPATELTLLIFLFRLSGWEITLGLIVLTGILGGFLAKRQGWQIWGRIKGDLAAGILPTIDLIHGLFILIAGALLLTPGLLTDISGFLLLVPAVRLFLGKKLLTKFGTKVGSAKFTYEHVNTRAAGSQGSPDDEIIDVDATVSPVEKMELDGK